MVESGPDTRWRPAHTAGDITASRRPARASSAQAAGAGYTVNELPQPQLALALGFTKCSPLPINAASYSSDVPAR